MNKSLNVINLFGEPCVGKSVLAAQLYAEMKIQGYNVELVTEYAKDLVWSERSNMFEEQAYIFSKQNHRLHRLRGKVDYAITDSPLPLALLYLPATFPKSFLPFCMDIFNTYDNINILLQRGDWKYQQEGRNQDESGASKVRDHLISMLDENLSYLRLQKSDNSVSDIIDIVTSLS